MELGVLAHPRVAVVDVRLHEILVDHLGHDDEPLGQEISLQLKRTTTPNKLTFTRCSIQVTNQFCRQLLCCFVCWVQNRFLLRVFFRAGCSHISLLLSFCLGAKPICH